MEVKKMTALELVAKKYQGTDIDCADTTGMKTCYNDLDCNCVDCGDSADCSTSW